jgi:tripartite ATP-independent transporter DctM subunit
MGDCRSHASGMRVSVKIEYRGRFPVEEGKPKQLLDAVLFAERLQAIEREQPGLPACRTSRLSLSVVIDWVLQALLAVALIGELAVVFLNVLSRAFFNSPWLWANEVAELALATIAFLGGAFAYRRGQHAFIRTLIDALPLIYRRACYALVELLVLVVALAAGASSLSFCVVRWEQVTPVLQIPAGWFVLPLVPCMVVLAVTAIERLLAQHRPTVLAVGVPVIALVLVLVLTQEAWKPWVEGDAAIALALGLFFAIVLVGLPVGFALLLSALAYLHAGTTMPMMMLAQTMTNGTTSFVLLAIPFFIFAGIIMEQGGISLRLVRLVQAMVGHIRGGLYQVMVVSMYIVSGLSGSKGADVAAVGLVMRDMLRRQGYSLERATAVLAASAAMGETVPPSLAMLVLVSVTTLSTGALFIAGFVPAAVVAACLMLLIYFQSRRSQVQRAPRANLRQLVKASFGGVLPLLMPVILFGGILLGVGTPTEVASFAVVYGVVLAGLIYRELGVRAFVRGMIDCATISGMILFILGAASSFAWTLTIAKVLQRLVGILTVAHQSQWIFLLASIVLLIVAGSILEGLPALLILAPILLPLASQIGVSQLHYGIVLLIAMGIGAFMPPVGVGFYFTCAICETTIEKSTREMIPYIVVLVLGLVLVALVPWFTLFLPALFHVAG